MHIQREQLEADVLIVGAGPAGVACALHLANLIKQHNRSGAEPELSAENVYVLEKGRDVGAHQLSGAILNPKALRELVPDFETSAPLDTPVTDSAALVFTEKSSYRIPITPPPFKNAGNYVISLSKLVKWLGGLVESAGVNIFKEFGGAELIYERSGIGGVITEDKGLDKNGKPEANFTPGYELHAKVTVLAEGPRGSLTKQLVAKKKLDNINPQIYGLVIALEYQDPLFDPHAAFQTLKTHPFLRNILDGGRLVRYGAKTLPYGGWYAMPRSYVDGGLIVGDSGSFLDSQRLKGVHLAMKSGMLAAETIFEALKSGDTSAKTLKLYKDKIDHSYIKQELWKVRNFHQSFRNGLLDGLVLSAFQEITGGHGLVDPLRAHPGFEVYGQIYGRPAPERFKGDGKLTFDRLTDVYHSGTRHEEDQPCHLKVQDLNICSTRCAEEYGNPCQYFCPAAVYEMVKEGSGQKLKINFANCVHCKTCDIADPYQIIDWTVPEGGGGPNYEGM